VVDFGWTDDTPSITSSSMKALRYIRKEQDFDPVYSRVDGNSSSSNRAYQAAI